jgi:hypothetical protein
MRVGNGSLQAFMAICSNEAGTAAPAAFLGYIVSASDIVSCFPLLDSAQKHENDKDHENQSHPTTRVVSPAIAVPPTRQGSKKHQQKNHDQNCSKHLHTSRSRIEAGAIKQRCGLFRDRNG